MNVSADSQATASATSLTRDPQRLTALCELWKDDHRAVWLTLTGYSMAPALLPGTRVKVQCGTALANLVIGDILAFRRDGIIVIHRLVAIEGTSAICKGDGNLDTDPPIAAEEVLGRVVEMRAPALLVRLRKRLGHLLLLRRRAAQADHGRPA